MLGSQVEGTLRYSPARVESHVLSHAEQLGFETTQGQYSEGCAIWRNADSLLGRQETQLLQQFLAELEQYSIAIQRFNLSGERLVAKDLQQIDVTCSALRLHPDGLLGVFKSGLSLTSAGFVEPLLPPMRHPKFCGGDRKYLMNMDYLVHDFQTMCRNLSPTSRIVLFDLGASLSFHRASGDQPIVTLINLYEKFGFTFDHIYAFEKKFSDPEDVYKALPDDLISSYHWINNGVETLSTSKLNPWNLLKQFNEDDLIIVKLDIDTPSVEMALVEQVLRDVRVSKLIDHFYFEHHVHLQELKRDWGEGVNGSVAASLRLFHELREQGIAAHFWV